ncbi:PfkB family carbohydrate kinase [Phenylobacterium montanum]|uniref:pyridoxal kinase n=1 Tax=Phenylobacterium montanum TaxID=2823693 RepID=A0A975ITB5_9CAUL|nr:PfkB family carbohydrate kinase [Caulobacter sp. S6]QUD86565.1 bifunctional hydroxymethylpyrimidine kinase/phosphomethylpyrimidine kinase [Caulobacter sp. S6]
MPLALILSSHVASSRVGGFVQALALSQLKIDPVLVPTVLFGRHPGWGAPGGDPVRLDTFQGVLDGVEANGLFGVVDLVITGYFANGAQVRAAAAAIDRIRAADRGGAYAKKPRIIVDPIMGDDDKGLYVNAEVAEALVTELVPRADLITPNAWEMQRLTGTPVRDARAARAAGRVVGKPSLVSSVRHGSDLAVVYADGPEAWVAAHARLAKAPNGVGDLLTALFAAALVEDQPISYAMARAVGAVYETVAAAEAWAASELPVVAMGPRLRQASSNVRIERLV